jgi:hypothetical protein
MKTVFKVSLSVAVLAALAFATPTQSQAQVCVGYPTSPGQFALAVNANFPTGGNQFGVNGNYNMAGPASFYAGIMHDDREVGPSVTSIGGGVALQVPALTEALPAGVSACPTAAINVATAEGLDNIISIPVGIGFGTTVGIGETLTLSPWVIPQFRFTLATDDIDASTDWLLSGGVLLGGFLGPLYAGATVNHIFVEGTDSVLGFTVGMTF